MVSFTFRMTILIWTSTGKYGNVNKLAWRDYKYARGIHSHWFHVFKLHFVDKYAYFNCSSFHLQFKKCGFSCWKGMFIVLYSVCSIRKVQIHDSYFHNKAFQSPANKLLYGCTIDFTFTCPDLKRLWDCPWIPNLCATQSLSSWHPLSSVNWQDYSLNRISLPFIPWTTGQSGRWQPSDSIQMEMKASEERCSLSNTAESFWVHAV